MSVDLGDVDNLVGFECPDVFYPLNKTVMIYGYFPSAYTRSSGTTFSVFDTDNPNAVENFFALLATYDYGIGLNGKSNSNAWFYDPANNNLTTSDGWDCLSVSFESSVTRKKYINGVSDHTGSSGNLSAMTSLNYVGLGFTGRKGGGSLWWLGGYIAEFVVWDRILTPQEHAMLGAWRKPPTDLHYEDIIIYQPLRDDINDDGYIGSPFAESSLNTGTYTGLPVHPKFVKTRQVTNVSAAPTIIPGRIAGNMVAGMTP